MFNLTLRKRSSTFGLALACGIGILTANGISRTLARGQNGSAAAGNALLADSTIPVPVRSILQRACQDCHSENTVWPWYAHVPPVSWQIRSDVTRGRAFMNLSKWSEYSDDERRGFMLAILAVTKGRIMPPPMYVWMHDNARLSDADLKEIQKWAAGEARVRPKTFQAVRVKAYQSVGR
jgi:hypothetical protein